MTNLEDIYQLVYEHILANGWKWRIDGLKQRPSYDDARMMVDNMVAQVRKSPGSISIESGGLLVKRTDDYIDVYVFAGGIK
jgi:hypothetical protein